MKEEQHDDHCWLKVYHEPGKITDIHDKLVWLEHQDGTMSLVDLIQLDVERYCKVAAYLLRENYGEQT